MAESRIRASYWIESPLPLDQAARKLAAAAGPGTFTAVPGETEELQRRFSVEVESVEETGVTHHPSLPYWTEGAVPALVPHRRAHVTLSIPLELTGTDLTALLAAVAGGLFGLRELSGVRLLDFDLPPVFGEVHPGPQFGIGGTRRLAGVADGPILASIIKPNVGLTPDQTAAIVRDLAEAGVDFVKDDEKMTDPLYSTIEQRSAAVMKVINAHADRTGKKVMYAFNITHTDPEAMVRAHDTVERAGGTCVMVSVAQVGLSGLLYLRKRCRLPIHAHRNGWDTLNRCAALGWDFRAWQKILRLAGVDHLHVNGIRNKYWEDDDSVVHSIEACLQPLYSPEDRLLPVLGSGMWAGQVPETWRRTQTTDVMYIAGGGIQAHPDGPAAGVRSIRQAWEAARSNVTLEDYARTHSELAQAIAKFG